MLKIKKLIETIVVMIILMTAIILAWEGFNYIDEGDSIDEKSCNVSNIKLQGGLITYISNEGKNEYGDLLWDETASEDIVRAIKEAEENNNIRAIVLEIDSLGGYPVAAEEVANALKRAKKPTIALIRRYGLSAAYYSATGADIIFASQNSDVGSIGITSSYLDNTEKNEKDGLTLIQLNTGKFKDMLNPDKPLTEEERKLVERDLNILHENFIQAVAKNRNIDIEKVRQLADGSSMPGQMALENNLIDQIGGKYEVEKYLKERVGDDIVLCK